MVKKTTYTVLETHRDRISIIEFLSNGIVFIKIDDNIHIELEDSIRQFEFLKSRFDGKNKHRVLVEPGNYTEISKEAREFSGKTESNTMTLGMAVIAKSLAQRILVNFIISITRHQHMKMRLFDSKETAIEWLLNLEQ